MQRIALALAVAVYFGVAVSALAQRSALAALTPTAPADAELVPAQAYAAVQHADGAAATTVAAAEPAAPHAHAAAGFALIQDMMHSLNSQLDTVVEREYSLAQTAERTKRAQQAVAHSVWGAAADASAAAAADEHVITPLTGGAGSAEAHAAAPHATVLVSEKSSVASTAAAATQTEAEEGEAETADEHDAEHHAMRLTDAAFVETGASAAAETDAEAEAEAETEAEADSEAEADAETETEKPKKGAAKAKGGEAKAAKGKAQGKGQGKGKGEKQAAAAGEGGVKSKARTVSEAAVKAVSGAAANVPLEPLRRVPLIPKDANPLSDMQPLNTGADAGLSHLFGSPLLNPKGAGANPLLSTDARRGLPLGTTAAATTGSLTAKALGNNYLAEDVAAGNPWVIEAHSGMTPAAHAAHHLESRMFSAPAMGSADAFHAFAAHDDVAAWVHPEVAERGTLLHYLSTAENAVATSSKLYHSYAEALNQLMNQIRLYKPNVAEWVTAQKVKAVETVEGVKETLRTFGPQIRELTRVYTDALAKEQYYRKQASSLQAERMLQTSSPTVRAVEQAMLPNAQYENALNTLNHYLTQAAKVRSDAQAAILAKKKALKDGKRWLMSSHDTMMAWLKRQHQHLLVVLRQARTLAVGWQHNVAQFERVHSQAVHLVRQYQLALRRIDLEEQLRRMRLAWKTYEVRHANGVPSADGHADSYELSIKFGSLHRALHDLAHRQAYNGAPPAPPAQWLSILSADPTPKSSVPLNAPPLAQPLSDPAFKHFLNSPVKPTEAEHVPGSEPANHILDPLHVPSGHVEAYPTSYPHADLSHSAWDAYPHPHPHAAPGSPLPGSSVLPPANPPNALFKEPVKGDGEEKEKEKEKEKSEGGDEAEGESFIQKAAALSHALATGFGSEEVFSGAYAPPQALMVHPSNPVTRSEFFDSAPTYALPASLAAAIPHAAAPVIALQQQQQVTTMAPPPARHGGLPPPLGALPAIPGTAAAAQQPQGAPPVRHAVAPAMPTLPPPPLTSAVADYDGIDL